MNTNVALGLLVSVLLFMLSFVSIAVMRDPGVPLSQFKNSCKAMVAAGCASLGFRFCYTIYDGHFAVPWHVLCSHLLIVLGVLGPEVFHYLKKEK